jgi:hypothetical protein
MCTIIRGVMRMVRYTRKQETKSKYNLPTLAALHPIPKDLPMLDPAYRARKRLQYRTLTSPSPPLIRPRSHRLPSPATPSITITSGLQTPHS